MTVMRAAAAVEAAKSSATAVLTATECWRREQASIDAPAMENSYPSLITRIYTVITMQVYLQQLLSDKVLLRLMA